MDLTNLALYGSVFLVSAVAIAFAGTRLARLAAELAERTGMGEVLAGALFVGISTSLPGIITSVSTAYNGHVQLSIGNALGGLTAQTVFLVIADLAYRRVNLEHAAASITALAQATLLVSMLVVPLLAYAGPDLLLWHVHPASLGMFLLYGMGLRLLASIRADPMWSPVKTDETSSEKSDADPDEAASSLSMRGLVARFVALAAITAAAGYAIARSSVALVNSTGLSETAFGTLFTAIANSLPELVTAVAAVRIGAVNLAVGDIIGGNAFDVLFLSAADFFYLDGSIYAEMTRTNLFTMASAILMTGILLLGLISRQRAGPGSIGWESVTVIFLYVMSSLVLFL